MTPRHNVNINIVRKEQKNADLSFWLNKSIEERINAVEFLRSQHYALSGHNRIPRFIPAIRIKGSRN